MLLTRVFKMLFEVSFFVFVQIDPIQVGFIGFSTQRVVEMLSGIVSRVKRVLKM